MPKTNDHGAPRVGFYVCHCGHNIAGTVDVEAVAKYIAGLPNVIVSREYKYMCSDPGQELIQQDIKDHNLNRIVVASCSPLLHEHTFRTATEKGGLNPYYFHMVNIRENVSWVNDNKEEATQKSKDLARAAIQRVVHHKSLEPRHVPIHPDVLIVGGGIAGIHAALTMADAGKKVYLIEREPTIGGHMAKFDKTFPTLDCAACILTPKMSQVKNHPNITLWSYSEVTGVSGFVGDYSITVKRKPRYIIEDLCVGCLECIEGCVYKEGKYTDEFNAGLSKRKPIYIPFPQATPQIVTIDPETCIEFKSGKCKKTCVEKCDRNAFDFKQKEKIEEIKVGTIILTTGFQTFDARRIPYYGYGKYPNVYTSLEVERLVNASGPTGGDVVLRDGRHPKTVGIIHCVGSRDKNTNRWCSRTCCMYSLKLAHLLKEHTDAEVYNFYIDIRAAGKSYEEFYDKVLEEKVHFIRVAQAGAAAAQAMKLIDKGSIELEPNTAYVVEAECSGCKTCLTMCPYSAILRDEVKQKAYINEALCKGCGTCVATCPSGAIKQNLFEDEMIYSEIDGLLEDLTAVEEGGKA
jgi:heterodisulfide reductase subunit A